MLALITALLVPLLIAASLHPGTRRSLLAWLLGVLVGLVAEAAGALWLGALLAERAIARLPPAARTTTVGFVTGQGGGMEGAILGIGVALIAAPLCACALLHRWDPRPVRSVSPGALLGWLAGLAVAVVSTIAARPESLLADPVILAAFGAFSLATLGAVVGRAWAGSRRIASASKTASAI